MPPRQSLDAHDIYFNKEETVRSLESCPTELQAFFKLILNIRDLKFEHFGGYETNNSDPSLVRFNPRQQYEKELKNEAIQLSVDCNDRRRPDDIENKWVQTLGPVVFNRFDREQEEKYKRDRHHHCFMCRKHFPVRSRPLISRTSERSIALKVEKWSDDREDDLCQEHFNLPNFDTVEQLAYPEFENEQKKIPDLTIGLLSYDPNEWSDLPNVRLVRDDRVQLFDQKLLRKLEDEGYLKPPFIRPGSLTKRVSDMCLAFPFGFWEAKREGGGSDHQSAQKQNALKVKMILSWQDQIGKKAEVPWLPLVWYFVSVGSKWEVHGCHFERNLAAREGHICVFRKLWSGDSANIDKALQLLYLVDLIALWGEHQYKPFAGACVRRFQSKLENKAPIPLEETLLACQVDINSNTFPWLVPEHDNILEIAPSRSGNRSKPRKQRAQSQSQFECLQSPQLLQEIENLSLTSHESSYIIPERDCFLWLLDRDPKRRNLLIVRIDEAGSVLPPLLIFDSADWEDHDFRYIVKEEKARMPEDVLTHFRVSRKERPYMEKCVTRSSGYFREPQCQFCVILPLDHENYKRQLGSVEAGSTVFGQLELLLGLPQLIEAAEKANEKWCQCQALYNRYSPNMIQCDNAKCPVGWYHMKCMDLAENFTADTWLCDRCLHNPQSIEYAEFDDEEIDAKIRKASDARIQRVRTLARVWKDHQWPNPEEVSRSIDQTSCRINIKERKDYDTIRDLNAKKRDESRCWAILKGSPKVMRAIRPIDGKSSSGTSKTAQTIKHRKSDCDVPSLAANRSKSRQFSSRLSVPRWRNMGLDV